MLARGARGSAVGQAEPNGDRTKGETTNGRADRRSRRFSGSGGSSDCGLSASLVLVPSLPLSPSCTFSQSPFPLPTFPSLSAHLPGQASPLARSGSGQGCAPHQPWGPTAMFSSPGPCRTACGTAGRASVAGCWEASSSLGLAGCHDSGPSSSLIPGPGFGSSSFSSAAGSPAQALPLGSMAAGPEPPVPLSDRHARPGLIWGAVGGLGGHRSWTQLER